MTELFIRTVREYPCLWNSRISSYKNLKVKELAWKEVLKETNMQSIGAAKIKWKALRDTHREKLKKIKDGKKVKSWRYMNHMEFLVPYVLITEYSSENSQNNTERVSPGAKKSKSSDDRLHEILKEIKKTREGRTMESLKVDSLKAFFDSMYKSTAQLPVVSQRKIKKHIFTLVMEAEESVQPAEVKKDIDVNSTTNSECSSVDAVSSRSQSPARGSGFRLIMDDDSDSE